MRDGAYKPQRLLAGREQFRQLIADGAARSKNRNHGKLPPLLIRCIEIDGRLTLSEPQVENQLGLKLYQAGCPRSRFWDLG